MRVMVIIKADPSSEAGIMPSRKLLNQMAAFNDELVKSGVMIDGDGLKPSSEGKRVHFFKGEHAVIDGPFSDTKELIAGYWIWRVSSMDEAVEWVKKCPSPMGIESMIEIRPIYELEDFGDEMTPEMRDKEMELRNRLDEERKNAKDNS